MMVWFGHEPLGPQGGRYGYGKLARRPFNVHDRITRATRTRRGSGNITVSRSASTPLHTIESASSTEHTSMSQAHRYAEIRRYNLAKISMFLISVLARVGSHNSP